MMAVALRLPQASKPCDLGHVFVLTERRGAGPVPVALRKACCVTERA